LSCVFVCLTEPALRRPRVLREGRTIPAPLAEPGECSEHETLYPERQEGKVDLIEVLIE
jgi:hypothetical protein